MRIFFLMQSRISVQVDKICRSLQCFVAVLRRKSLMKLETAAKAAVRL